MPAKVTNIVIAGLGGQGVLKASDVLGDALVRSGHDVKKSEVHGMAQRGGSVQSDIRFGPRVFSPMVPTGEADYLVVLAEDQVEVHRHLLRPGGLIITPAAVSPEALPSRKSLNVALLGTLSAHLDVPESHWREALRAQFPETWFDANCRAFALGRAGAGPAA